MSHERCPVPGCHQQRPFGYRWCVYHFTRRKLIEVRAKARRARLYKAARPVKPPKADPNMLTNVFAPIATHMEVADRGTLEEDFLVQTLRPGSTVVIAQGVP